MANRQQDQWGSRRSGNYRAWEDDDNERDYGRQSDNEQGRRYDTNEQSGSSGRYAGYGDFGQGDYSQSGRGMNTGQNRYGQSGYGQSGYGQGGYGSGQSGQSNYPRYGQEYGSSGTSQYGRSNYGSGRHERESSEYSRQGQGGRGFAGYGYGGSGSESYESGFDRNRGWNEPYGEGQQYDPGGGYGSQGSRYGMSQYGGQFGRGQGQHRGKGPKNYQRSDERIKEMICERLREDPEIDASEVTVNVQGGKVTFDGTVDSRHVKMEVEDIADQLGVQEVQNNLRVQRQGQGGQGQGMETSRTGVSKSATSLGTEETETSRQKRN
jgi:osmotically-inducible protein OsmY